MSGFSIGGNINITSNPISIPDSKQSDKSKIRGLSSSATFSPEDPLTQSRSFEVTPINIDFTDDDESDSSNKEDENSEIDAKNHEKDAPTKNSDLSIKAEYKEEDLTDSPPNRNLVESKNESVVKQKKIKTQKFLNTAKDFAASTPVLQIAVVTYNVAKVFFSKKSFSEVFGVRPYKRNDNKNVNMTGVGLAVTAYYYTKKGIRAHINRKDINKIALPKKVDQKRDSEQLDSQTSHSQKLDSQQLDLEQFDELVTFLKDNPTFTKVKELLGSPKFKTEAREFTEQFLAIDFDNPKKARRAMDQFNDDFFKWMEDYLKTNDPNSFADFRIAFICSDHVGYDEIFKKLQNIHPQAWQDMAKVHNDPTGDLSALRITLLKELVYNFQIIKNFHSSTIIEQKFKLRNVISSVIDDEKRAQFQNEFDILNNTNPFAKVFSGPLTKEQAADVINDSSQTITEVQNILSTLNIKIDDCTIRIHDEEKLIKKAEDEIASAENALQNTQDPNMNTDEIKNAIVTAKKQIENSKSVINTIKEQGNRMLQINQVKRAFENQLNMVMHLRHDIINEMIKQES